MEGETLNPSSSPPPPPEPPQKKLKLSTETPSDDPTTDSAAVDTTKKPNYRRRKVAIFFAYCGVGYQGMQKNPGAKTIEGDLEEALHLAGAVPDQDAGQPRRWDWARSARTDKGVSAVGQVSSGWFCVDPPGFVERLNSHLPDQIRIFGYKRVTPTFSAKKLCDRRRYVYLIPVFALDPNSHLDRDSECLDCPERVSGTDLVDSESVVQSGISSNREAAMVEGENENEPLPIGNGEVMRVKRGEFSYGEKEKERFNRILKHYEGTHNFHNFTTRTKSDDPSAKRYIVSFSANTTVTIQGIEFVKCDVVGQSFMLHQIRKMIGLALAIMRNCADESIFDTAFQQDVHINVPMAPEVGLYLDECLFTSYNKRWKKSHEEVSMNSYSKEAEEFKMKYIYSHIANNEHTEGLVGRWLHYLNLQNYPDLCPPQSGSVAPDLDPPQSGTVAPDLDPPQSVSVAPDFDPPQSGTVAPDLDPPQSGSVADTVAPEADNAGIGGDSDSNRHLISD